MSKELCLQDDLLKAMESLWLSAVDHDGGGDVSFCVEGKIVKAHRFVLSMQSPVFRQMLLSSNFRESRHSLEQPIPLPNKQHDTFMAFLKCLYTGAITLDCIDTELHLLSLANEYGVTSLFNALVNELLNQINLSTIFPVLEAAVFLSSQCELLEACIAFICENADDFLNNTRFGELSKEALCQLFARDELDMAEIDILMAISRWHDSNPDVDLKEILETVRFQHVEMTNVSFCQFKRLYELLTSQNFDFQRIENFQQKPRGCCFQNENVATQTMNVKVYGSNRSIADVENLLCSAVMDANTPLTMERVVRAVTLREQDDFVTVQLSRHFLIDTLQFFVGDCIRCVPLGYSVYQVQTSADGEKWDMLADVANINCFGRQLLMFEARRIKFIKIGKSAGQRSDLQVNGFECPAKVTDEDEERYGRLCPSGGTMLYQTHYPANGHCVWAAHAIQAGNEQGLNARQLARKRKHKT